MKKTIAPLIVLEGNEKFLKDEEISSLRVRMESIHPRVEVLELDGNAISTALVLDEVRNYPLFPGGKIVVLRNAQTLLEQDGDIFKKYLDSPTTFSCLLLDVEKLDGRSVFAKAAKAANIIKTCEPLAEREAPAWLIKRAQEMHHKRLNQEDARLIVDFVGADLSLLSSELEKLVSLSPDSPSISREKIESVVVRGRARDLFALANAVERKDAKTAVTILVEIMRQGALQRDATVERDLDRIQEQVVNTLRWSVNRLIRANIMLEKGATSEKAAQELGVHSYYADSFIAILKRFRKTECLRCHSEILASDIALKSGDRDSESVLTTLVLSLCK